MQKYSRFFMKNNISMKTRRGGSVGKQVFLWSLWIWRPWNKVLCPAGSKAGEQRSWFAIWTVYSDHIVPPALNISLYGSSGPCLVMAILTWLSLGSSCVFFIWHETPWAGICSLGMPDYWLSRREVHRLQELCWGCRMLQGGPTSSKSLSKQNANGCVWLCSLVATPPNAQADLCFLLACETK